LRGGWNGFGYVNGAPLDHVDPTGKIVFVPFLWVAAAGAATGWAAWMATSSGQQAAQDLGSALSDWIFSSGNEDAMFDVPVPPYPGISDLAKDCVPGKRLVSVITNGRHKGQTNIEQEYQCSCGMVTRHTIVKASGKVVHDHFRPGPAKGTDGD
jgi:hypothetical protein